MKSAEVKNTADEEQVKEAAKRERYKTRQEDDDIRSVMATPQGRRVFWRLLCHCGTFETVFTGNSESTAYNSGKQDVGHFIMATLSDTCPNEFDLMSKEARKGKV
jgi:hypothetical protein